jgi:hypothetical protein
VSSLLPCHPHRLNNEILSSWMLSIASDNGVSVRRLCGTPQEFEYLDVKSRAFMLQAVVSLFADWPDYLVDVLRSTNHLRHLHHLLKNKSVPGWYESAVRIAQTRNRKPKSSDREQFLDAAVKQGWVSAVQFAEEARDSGRFLDVKAA